MTEILNTCIHSFWFWLAFYAWSMCVAYFLIVKFKLFGEDDFLISLVVMLPHIVLAIYIASFLAEKIGSFIKYLAAADDLTEEDKTTSK